MPGAGRYLYQRMLGAISTVGGVRLIAGLELESEVLGVTRVPLGHQEELLVIRPPALIKDRLDLCKELVLKLLNGQTVFLGTLRERPATLRGPSDPSSERREDDVLDGFDWERLGRIAAHALNQHEDSPEAA